MIIVHCNFLPANLRVRLWMFYLDKAFQGLKIHWDPHEPDEYIQIHDHWGYDRNTSSV